jgi:hypothetical protein
VGACGTRTRPASRAATPLAVRAGLDSPRLASPCFPPPPSAMLGLAQARTSLRRSAGDCARVASRSGASSSGSSSAPRLSQVQLRAHTRAAAAARRALATTATASKASAPAAAPLHRTRAQLSDLPDKVLVRTGPLGR